ncbi:MAG: tRNA pseudouridine(54/55) synthase Pus10 [Candidatus Thermoplasmatota archaeon]|nr:tRNA pseudouridine(54/55) synthase Pus10 [Candidatus Thermoplasmatota archaeon]MBS3790916.1 tRNA pseudouridine(54/55) synthase Pus10 [Candidatus Thermoplasmatota archaeon]
MTVIKLLEKVENALEKDLCDHCLGRLFAQLGTGITNAERGKSLRISYAMFTSEEQRKEVPEEPENCELCSDLFNEVEKFADLAAGDLQEYEFRDFLIGSRIDPEIEENEEKIWTELNLTTGEPIKSEVNREVGKLVQEMIEKEVNLETPDIKAIIDTRFDSVDIEISPLFIYGRYKKLSREIPQTKWTCKRCRGKGCDKCGGTGKMYETSVEEIIGGPLVEMTSGKDFTLHGMGREDIDAKMLGDGRPFVIEIKEPIERKIDLKKFERMVNESEMVQIHSLEFTEKEKVVELKQARAIKTYRVDISLKEAIEGARFKKVKYELVGQEISQRTPRRVDHRRADKIRKRKIRDLKLISMESTSMTLDITCDAGTYVKEFVHGDEGRTQPNLAEMFETKCEVDKLDVMKIHYPEGEKDEKI